MSKFDDIFYPVKPPSGGGTGGTGGTNADATKIQGKTVPAPVAGDDEKVLAYDNDTNSFKFITPVGGNTSALEAELGINQPEKKTFTSTPAYTTNMDTSLSAYATYVGYDFRLDSDAFLTKIEYQFNEDGEFISLWDVESQTRIAEWNAVGVQPSLTTLTLPTPIQLMGGKEYFIGLWCVGGANFVKRVPTLGLPLGEGITILRSRGTAFTTYLRTDFPQSTATGYTLGHLNPVFGVVSMKTSVANLNTKVGNAVKIQGKVIPTPVAGDDEKVLAYDNDTNSFKFITPASGGTSTSNTYIVNGYDLLKYEMVGSGSTTTLTTTSTTIGKVLNTVTFTITSAKKLIIESSLYASAATTTSDHYMYISPDNGVTLWFLGAQGDISVQSPALTQGVGAPSDITGTRIRLGSNWSNISGSGYVTIPAGTYTVGFYKSDSDSVSYASFNSYIYIWAKDASAASLAGNGLISFNSTYTAVGGETNIPIGISQYAVTDILEVYQGGIRIFSGHAWVLGANNTSIDLQGYTANANERFDFVCLKPKPVGGGEALTVTTYGGHSETYLSPLTETTIAQF